MHIIFDTISTNLDFHALLIDNKESFVKNESSFIIIDPTVATQDVLFKLLDKPMEQVRYVIIDRVPHSTRLYRILLTK